MTRVGRGEDQGLQDLIQVECGDDGADSWDPSVAGGQRGPGSS